MSHFAKVKDGIVTQVIVAEQDFVDTQEGTWVQSCFDDDVPLRKNCAVIGFTYDATRDAFIPPQPYPSWVLNEDTCLWEAPIAYPDDGNMYIWNEDTQQWDEITQP